MRVPHIGLIPKVIPLKLLREDYTYQSSKQSINQYFFNFLIYTLLLDWLADS